MEISAILFDLDGVFCSTDRFHYRAWKELADRLGLPFNEEINRQLRGVSRMESLEILLRGSERKFTFQEKAALAEENNRRYRQLLMGLTQADVSPPVRQTLRELRARGVPAGLLQEEHPADPTASRPGHLVRCRDRRQPDHPLQAGPGGLPARRTGSGLPARALSRRGGRRRRR